MYTVNVIDFFSSAHFLRDYKGKCEAIHGHNYKVEVSLKSNELQKNGILIDFTDLKKDLKEILRYLDHKNLNDLEEFKTENPTSENIAKFIFDKMKQKYKIVSKVRIWETEKQYAEYFEE